MPISPIMPGNTSPRMFPYPVQGQPRFAPEFTTPIPATSNALPQPLPPTAEQIQASQQRFAAELAARNAQRAQELARGPSTNDDSGPSGQNFQTGNPNDSRLDGPIGNTAGQTADGSFYAPDLPGREYNQYSVNMTPYGSHGEGYQNPLPSAATNPTLNPYDPAMWGVDPRSLQIGQQRRALLERERLGLGQDPVTAAMQQAALGRGPSAAQGIMNQGMAQQMNDQMSLANSAGGNQMQRYGAMQIARDNISRMQGQYAAQGAAMRLAELNQDRGAYLQNQGQNYGQNLGYLAAQGQLSEQDVRDRQALARAMAGSREGGLDRQARADANNSNHIWQVAGPIAGALATTGGIILAKTLGSPSSPTQPTTTDTPSVAGTPGETHDVGGNGYNSGWY